MLKTSADILTRPPWAIFFHPPDPPIALQSFTRDAPFSLVAMASNINDPSKLARSPFGAGLIGLLLRAWTSTDFLQIRLIWRARSASKGDQPARTPLHSSFRPCARLGKLRL